MNITLSAEEDCIKLSREYARKHGMSLNQLIRDYLDNNAGSSGVCRRCAL